LQIDNKEKRKKEQDSFPKGNIATKRLVLAFFGSVHFKYIVIPSIVLSLITFYSTLYSKAWIVSDIDHFYFEIFAVILSTIVAFYCITRAYTLKEKFSLFVGIGFSTIAVIDLLHAVFSYSAVGNTGFLEYFIPQTWFAGRTFLGAMLVIAVAKYAPKVWQQTGKQTQESQNADPSNYSDNSGRRLNDLEVQYGEEKLEPHLLLSLSMLAFLAVSVVAISFFAIFPGVVISYSTLHRPYEIPSLVLFSIALFLFYKKRLYSVNDAFYKGILGALIIDVFGQIIMSYSGINFYTAHNVAHMLKNSGYFIIVLSLAISSIQYNKIAKEREATILLQYNKLKQMDKMKDEFINVAAHELRTPIQPIIGLSELLRSRMKNTVVSSEKGTSSNSSNSQNQEFVDIIMRNGKRLQKLIDDVLDVTKIDSQSLQLNKEHFDLNDLIIDIIDDMIAADAESMASGLAAKEKRMNTPKIIYNPRHLSVYADKNRISQVISNLLDNAKKFTQAGYIVLATDKIAGNTPNNSLAFVAVRDSGSGIDPEIMPRLFTKFSSRSFSGTGLGLYISKNIVEAHGGRIWAKNNKDGRGATFSFVLPMTS
jgi:signal transduction histidine kinase